MNIAVVRRWRDYLRHAALFALLAGCVFTPQRHQMGDPLAGLGVKAAASRPASLRHLAHKDIALLYSPNTRAVLDAVDVSSGSNILFDAWALPRSPKYDFAGQITAASGALFEDRFSKVVTVSSLAAAARKDLRTAVILDLQVFDNKPRPAARGSLFRARVTAYFVDVKSRRQLGALTGGEMLRLSRAQLGRNLKTANARRNALLNRVLAKAYWSLSREMDAHLGNARVPVATVVAASTPKASSRHARPKQHRHHNRRAHRQLARFAWKMHRLDEMHAYGLYSDDQYEVRKQRLRHRYRHYLD